MRFQRSMRSRANTRCAFRDTEAEVIPSGGTGNRIRASDLGKGFSLQARSTKIRNSNQQRLPQHRPRFTPEARKANQAVGIAWQARRTKETKEGDTCADRDRLPCAAPKTGIVPHPGNDKATRLEENFAALTCNFRPMISPQSKARDLA